ncbi:MAG: lipid-A-disaccharide synthase [candidate division KSB1 bacterium]|jgi:lipid-A-disaccharide synthase|nr:lipid-A-disaccharide synthase [candidate division KSB1 bacterium]
MASEKAMTTHPKNDIMIIAGEASGDLHASNLVREMRALDPEVTFFGIGGDRMRAEGVELEYHIQDMSVLGFGDVIKKIFFFRSVIRILKRRMKKDPPRMLILIDYPGMNLKLAAAAKEFGIKVFYYIAPQVWAWGSGRIRKMAECIDSLAVILPFEEPLFRNAGIDARFVGHPLLDMASAKSSRSAFLNAHQLDGGGKIIGLLPGSRTQEVKRLLPEMVATFEALLEDDPDIQGIVACTSTVDKNLYQELTQNKNVVVKAYDQTYDVMQHADLLIVASGTATLESALFETPMIIVYRVDPLSFFLGKRLVKLKNIGLVNVIAGKEIVPEFIQHDFNAEKVASMAGKLLFDDVKRTSVIKNLKQIRHNLGSPGAAKRAAEMALALR